MCDMFFCAQVTASYCVLKVTDSTLWHFAHVIAIQGKIAWWIFRVYEKKIEVALDVKEKSALQSFTQGKSLEGDNIGFYH